MFITVSIGISSSDLRSLTKDFNELVSTVHELKVYVKNIGSAHSSSISDINNLFERNARKEVQSKLYRAFGLSFQYITKTEKKLNDSTIFSLISSFIPGKRTTTDGEIDVYFGVQSPNVWNVLDAKFLSDIYVVSSGSFKDAAKSLNQQKNQEKTLTSPNSSELPKSFNYYCIFEVSTGSDLKYKLNQLETQMQYIVARDLQGCQKQFYRGKNLKEYGDWISKRVIYLIAFCGLIFAKEFGDVRSEICRIINENSGYNRPCLWALLKANRFLYMKSAMLSERFESLEEFSDSKTTPH